MTREEYIAMTGIGRSFQGFLEDGGYADKITIVIESDHFEYPNDKIPLQGAKCFQIKTVQVCLLSVPSLSSILPQPPKPKLELDKINQHLQTIKEHIIAAQKYERLNSIVEYYNQLEIEFEEFRRRRTKRDEGFTSRAKRRVNSLIRETEKKLESNSIKLKELDVKRKTETDPVLQAEIIRDIDKVIECNDEIQKMIGELNELAVSTQVIDIRDEEPVTKDSETYEMGSHEFEDNKVVLKVEKGIASEMQLLAHELKHAFQFVKSEISIIPKGADATTGNLLFYDKYDELKAYKRGSIFGGPIYETIDSLPPAYKNRPKEYYDKYTHPYTRYLLGTPDQERKLQRVADKWNVIFRIDGKTYIPSKK
ncbi:MAG: hypothetical protein LBE91_10150 [Tannerella sp.]|jgi:hypothetical protein|nr:hypothetical protein [Tannerella sp.]